jgi:hypothetical protein
MKRKKSEVIEIIFIDIKFAGLKGKKFTLKNIKYKY